MGSVIGGFFLMASVIFAVGPQNALLIKCGMTRDHPYLIALIFTLCDLMLISLGIFGVGHFIADVKPIKMILVIGGAAFLLYFSLKAFISAYKGGQQMATETAAAKGSLIAKAFAVSLLNPGAIIDTTVIIGSVSSTYDLKQAIMFGIGAQTFSTLFFFSLAAVTRTIAPILQNQRVWRCIDVIIGLITITIAIQLIEEILVII